MATFNISQPSDQARTYARAAQEAVKKASEQKRLAASIDVSRLPEAEQQRFSALAYDAMLALRAQAAGAKLKEGEDQITAEAFWWGWHLSVPHSQVEPLIDGSEAIATIIEAALHVIPEVGELIALGVKGYTMLYGGLIRLVDQGNGVYLSQTWLNTPGILFIPTTR